MIVLNLSMTLRIFEVRLESRENSSAKGRLDRKGPIRPVRTQAMEKDLLGGPYTLQKELYLLLLTSLFVMFCQVGRILKGVKCIE